MAADPGQLELGVQPGELGRELGEQPVEGGGVDPGRVAVGDRRDPDQGLELADDPAAAGRRRVSAMARNLVRIAG